MACFRMGNTSYYKNIYPMIIYCTTNLTDGMMYLGKDKYNNPDYLGSGTNLKRAIKKCGRENFHKRIIEHCHNIEELNFAEKEWVKVDRKRTRLNSSHA